MPRYRLSFHLEFDSIDDPAARVAVAIAAREVSERLEALRAALNGPLEFSSGKLQRLYSDQPPKLVRWYDSAGRDVTYTRAQTHAEG